MPSEGKPTPGTTAASASACIVGAGAVFVGLTFALRGGHGGAVMASPEKRARRSTASGREAASGGAEGRTLGPKAPGPSTPSPAGAPAPSDAPGATGAPGAVKPKPRWLLYLGGRGAPAWWRRLAGNDAGGIATYSSVGALYGYKMLWMIPLMALLLIGGAGVGRAHGRSSRSKGFSSLIRERFGIRLTALAMGALLVSNTAVTLSEFAGIASGHGAVRYPVVRVGAAGGPRGVAAVHRAAATSGSRRSCSPCRACSSPTWSAAFLAGPDWGEAPWRAPSCRRSWGMRGFFSLLIATIGTTIAPWMIFLAQNNVVDRGAGAESAARCQRADSVSGSIVACLIAWFIIVTTGTVLLPRRRRRGVGRPTRRAPWRPSPGRYAGEAVRGGPGGGVVPGGVRAAGRHLERRSARRSGGSAGPTAAGAKRPPTRAIITLGILVLSCLIVLVPNVNLFGVMTGVAGHQRRAAAGAARVPRAHHQRQADDGAATANGRSCGTC